ncbi:membrane protein [Clostridium lundense]|uniref:membrane protein n=1 Tax=Clostridium lundense TaxID=319475 RepID=UPI00047F7C9E|nr:membrane protein [Clostridium lundense]
MAMQREYGKEQPYLSAGPFKIRIPFVHYKFEWADYIQGLLMCAVCLGAIPMLQDSLGMPFEVAIAVVVLNGILYCVHVLLGDPVVPGWVTPAIPLLMLYVADFPQGPERIQALIAFEITLGLLALILGATGLGKKIVSIVPNAMQSGIILGAGIAAVNMIFVKGARFDNFPISIVICIGLGFYLLFSNHFKSIRNNNKFLKTISNLGILPIIVLAIIIGPLVGETQWPQIQWGFTKPDFGTLWREWTFWAVGFPPAQMFIKAVPMVFSAYIVLFGDMIQSQALLEDSAKFRPDEKIDYNPNRSHIIFGLRNIIMSIIGPDITMCGPLWAAMQVVVCERYKHGREAMDSINGGAGSFRFGTLTGYFLLPIVSLVKPILGIALASTMLIQGFVSVRVGVMKARTFNDLGIAGVMASVVATRGAAWGLVTGIVLCLLIQLGNKPEMDIVIFDEEKAKIAD